jgi:hypothetical protein
LGKLRGLDGFELKKNRGELKRKAETERKEGDLHERYPNFL